MGQFWGTRVRGQVKNLHKKTRTKRCREFGGFLLDRAVFDSRAGLRVALGLEPGPTAEAAEWGSGNCVEKISCTRQKWRWRREKSEHAGALYIWQ